MNFFSAVFASLDVVRGFVECSGINANDLCQMELSFRLAILPSGNLGGYGS